MKDIRKYNQDSALRSAQEAKEYFDYYEAKLQEAQEAFDKARENYESALRYCQEVGVEFEGE